MQPLDQVLGMMKQSSSPKGPNRASLVAWLRKQNDPAFFIAAMAAQPSKVRRNAFVKLTGLTAHPQGRILNFSEHQNFFRNFVGSDQLLGTLEQPKRMTEEEVRNLVKIWKNYSASQLISNSHQSNASELSDMKLVITNNHQEKEIMNTNTYVSKDTQSSASVSTQNPDHTALLETLAQERGVALAVVKALYEARSELHGHPWNQVEPALKRSIGSWKAAQTAAKKKEKNNG